MCAGHHPQIDNALALLTRLVSKREFNSLDKGTQALTDLDSDSLSRRFYWLHYITLNLFAVSWGVINMNSKSVLF